MALNLTQYIRQNRDKLIFLGIISALLGGGTLLYNRYKSERKTEARDLFVQSQNILLFPAQSSTNFNSLAQARQQFGRISSNFSELPIAAPAALYEANLEINQGDEEKGIELLREFIQKSPDQDPGPWQALAQRSICYGLELSGKLEQAEKAYIALWAQDLKWISRQEMLLGQARCVLNQGRIEEAKKILDKVVEEDSKSYWGRMASVLLIS